MKPQVSIDESTVPSSSITVPICVKKKSIENLQQARPSAKCRSYRGKKGELFTLIEFDPYRSRQKIAVMLNDGVMMAAVGPLEMSMVELEPGGGHLRSGKGWKASLRTKQRKTGKH